MSESPFKPASALPKRPKILVWGASGVGKTWLALQFPGVVLLDLDGGADQYGGLFPHDVMRANTADAIMQAVLWLGSNEHQYKTLVVDPISMYSDALRHKWNEIYFRTHKGKRGHQNEYYEFQPKDWMGVGAELKMLLRLIIGLDMNVVVTAREKDLYAEGEVMKKIGVTWDGDKRLPYEFDTVLHAVKRGREHNLIVEKDRTNKLSGEIQSTYATIEDAFGADVLNRSSVTRQRASDEQVHRIEELIEALEIPIGSVVKALANYGVDDPRDLTPDDALSITLKLETKLNAKEQTNASN